MTKLTKPCVRVNLVGPQVSLPTGAPQMSVGGIIFFHVIRRQLIACGQASGGSRVGLGSLRGITAGHKRREQEVPPVLV